MYHKSIIKKIYLSKSLKLKKMKKIILLAALAISITGFAATTATEPDNEKVMKTFNELFKGVNHVSWNETGNYHEAFFSMNNIKTRVLIDNKGKLVQTIRYYKENNLPANVLYSVKRTYSKQNIWGVTEVANNNGTGYVITLNDAKHWYNIKADAAGETELVSKYKRGDK